MPNKLNKTTIKMYNLMTYLLDDNYFNIKTYDSSENINDQYLKKLRNKGKNGLIIKTAERGSYKYNKSHLKSEYFPNNDEKILLLTSIFHSLEVDNIYKVLNYLNNTVTQSTINDSANQIIKDYNQIINESSKFFSSKNIEFFGFYLIAEENENNKTVIEITTKDNNILSIILHKILLINQSSYLCYENIDNNNLSLIRLNTIKKAKVLNSTHYTFNTNLKINAFLEETTDKTKKLTLLYTETLSNLIRYDQLSYEQLKEYNFEDESQEFNFTGHISSDNKSIFHKIFLKIINFFKVK